MDPASLVRKSEFEGFPIGGVAAFDPAEGGIVSAGGVGFDISCGVRTLRTGLTVAVGDPMKRELATALSRTVPAGVGSHGRIHLEAADLDAMLAGGARWAMERGYGVVLPCPLQCRCRAQCRWKLERARTATSDDGEDGS